MEAIIYEDKLITISDDSIILKNYYFPSSRSKRILFVNVVDLQIQEPSLRTGKWRAWGTGDFRSWYPLDSSRSKRDKIFKMIISDSWIRIGFTVEDSSKVIKIFKEKGLLK